MAKSNNVFMSQYLYTYVETEQVRQNVDGNYSVVKARVYLGRSNTGYSTIYTWSISASVNGNQINGSKKVVVTHDPVLLYETGEITIPHNNDGTKSFYTSFSLSCKNSSGPVYSGSVGVTTTLETIPRASSFTLDKDTIVLNGTDCFNINIQRHSTSFVHDIYLRFGNYAVELGRQIQTSKKYTPTADDIGYFLQQIPNDMRGYGTIDVYTLRGDTSIGLAQKTVYLEIDQTNYKPTINSSLTIKKYLTTKKNTNGNVIEQQSLIQNLGYLTIGAEGIGTKGHSTLSKVELAYGNTKVDVTNTITEGNMNYQTQPITTSGDIYIQVLVTDSRGLRTSSTVYTVESVAYTLPTITKFSAFRCDANKNENDEAFYIATDFVAQYSKVTYKNASGSTSTNQLNILMNRKQASWDKYYNSCVSFSTTEKQLESTRFERTVSKGRVPNAQKIGWTAYSQDEGDRYFDTDVPYMLELKVYDSLGGTAIAYFEVGSASTILDLYQDGTGLAIGKVAQGSGLEIDWDTKINGTLTVGGKQIISCEETTHTVNNSTQVVKKYSNGDMEIVYMYTADMNISATVWNNWYSSGQITPPDFAVAFKETPTTIKNLTSGTGFFTIYRNPTTTNPGTIEMLRPANASSGTFTLHIIAKGKYQ